VGGRKTSGDDRKLELMMVVIPGASGETESDK